MVYTTTAVTHGDDIGGVVSSYIYELNNKLGPTWSLVQSLDSDTSINITARLSYTLPPGVTAEATATDITIPQGANTEEEVSEDMFAQHIQDAFDVFIARNGASLNELNASKQPTTKSIIDAFWLAQATKNIPSGFSRPVEEETQEGAEEISADIKTFTEYARNNMVETTKAFFVADEVAKEEMKKTFAEVIEGALDTKTLGNYWIAANNSIAQVVDTGKNHTDDVKRYSRVLFQELQDDEDIMSDENTSITFAEKGFVAFEGERETFANAGISEIQKHTSDTTPQDRILIAQVFVDELSNVDTIFQNASQFTAVMDASLYAADQVIRLTANGIVSAEHSLSLYTDIRDSSFGDQQTTGLMLAGNSGDQVYRAEQAIFNSALKFMSHASDQTPASWTHTDYLTQVLALAGSTVTLNSKYTTPQQLRAIPDDNFQVLPSQAITNIHSDVFGAFNGNRFSSLTDEAIAEMSVSQVIKLPPEALVNAGSTQMASFNSDVYSILNSQHMEALPPQALENINSAQMTNLLPEAIFGLSYDTFSHLPDQVIKAITSNQSGSFSEQLVSGFQSDDIQSLSDEALSGLEAKHVKILSDAALKGFDKNNVKLINPNAFLGFEVAERLNIMSENALSGITAEQFANLRGSEYEKLSPFVGQNLSVGVYAETSSENISRLSSQYISESLTSSHIKNMPDNAFSNISKDQFKAIQSDAIAGFNAIQLYNLNKGVFSVINKSQAMNIPPSAMQGLTLAELNVYPSIIDYFTDKQMSNMPVEVLHAMMVGSLSDGKVYTVPRNIVKSRGQENSQDLLTRWSETLKISALLNVDIDDVRNNKIVLETNQSNLQDKRNSDEKEEENIVNDIALLEAQKQRQRTILNDLEANISSKEARLTQLEAGKNKLVSLEGNQLASITLSNFKTYIVDITNIILGSIVDNFKADSIVLNTLGVSTGKQEEIYDAIQSLVMSQKTYATSYLNTNMNDKQLMGIKDISSFKSLLSDINDGSMEHFKELLRKSYVYFKDDKRLEGEYNFQGDTSNSSFDKFHINNGAELFTLWNIELKVTSNISDNNKDITQEIQEVYDYIEDNFIAMLQNMDPMKYNELYKILIAEYFRLAGNDVSEVYTDLLKAAHDFKTAADLESSLSIINDKYINLLLVFDLINRRITNDPHDNYYFDMLFSFRPLYFDNGLSSAPMLGGNDILFNEKYSNLIDDNNDNIDDRLKSLMDFNNELNNFIHKMEENNLSTHSYASLPPDVIYEHKLVSDDIIGELHIKLGWDENSSQMLDWSPVTLNHDEITITFNQARDAALNSNPADTDGANSRGIEAIQTGPLQNINIHSGNLKDFINALDIRELIFNKSILRDPDGLTSNTKTILEPPESKSDDSHYQNYTVGDYYGLLLQHIEDGTEVKRKKAYGIHVSLDQKNRRDFALGNENFGPEPIFNIKADIISDNNDMIEANKNKASNEMKSSILDLVAFKYNLYDGGGNPKLLIGTAETQNVENYYSTHASDDAIEDAIHEIFKNDDLTKIIISLLYDKYAIEWNANGGTTARAAFQANALYDLINEKIWFTNNPTDPDTSAAWTTTDANEQRTTIKAETKSQLRHAASFDAFFFRYQRDVIGYKNQIQFKTDSTSSMRDLSIGCVSEKYMIDDIIKQYRNDNDSEINYHGLRTRLVLMQTKIRDLIYIQITDHKYDLSNVIDDESNLEYDIDFKVKDFIESLNRNIINIQVIIDFIDLYLKENKFIEYNKNLFNYDIRYWDVSAADNMDELFKDATDFNEDISRWDVSKVTSMKNMFDTASVFNQNIGRWKVNNVTDVTKMFKDADAFNQKSIRWWSLDEDTNVDNMFVSTTTGRAIDKHTAIISESTSSTGLSVTGTNLGDGDLTNNQIEKPIMTQVTGDNKIEIFFNKAFKPTSKTELRKAIAYYMDPGISNKLIEIDAGLPDTYDTNINEWDMDDMTDQDLSNLFTGTHYGVDFSKFNEDIGNWNVSKVTDMSGMFKNTKLFNQDISSWDVGEVNNMSSMFEGAKRFNNRNNSLNNWNVIDVTDMSSMFKDTDYFNQLIGMWDVRKVQNMSKMFQNAKKFNRDLQWHTRDVTDLSFMFDNASNFNGDITTFYTNNVTTMEAMFRNAKKFDQRLFRRNITFKPGKGTDEEEIRLISWVMGINENTGVANITEMFFGAEKFGRKLSANNEVKLLLRWNIRESNLEVLNRAFSETYLSNYIYPFNRIRGLSIDDFNNFEQITIQFDMVVNNYFDEAAGQQQLFETTIKNSVYTITRRALGQGQVWIDSIDDKIDNLEESPEKNIFTRIKNNINSLNSAHANYSIHIIDMIEKSGIRPDSLISLNDIAFDVVNEAINLELDESSVWSDKDVLSRFISTVRNEKRQADVLARKRKYNFSNRNNHTIRTGGGYSFIERIENAIWDISMDAI
jgi:surface protein